MNIRALAVILVISVVGVGIYNYQFWTKKLGKKSNRRKVATQTIVPTPQPKRELNFNAVKDTLEPELEAADANLIMMRAYNDELRNPFLTVEEEQFFEETGEMLTKETIKQKKVEEKKPPKPNYVLQAAIVGVDRKLCYMNDNIYTENDIIGDETITSITLDSVTLEDLEGETRTIILPDNVKAANQRVLINKINI